MLLNTDKNCLVKKDLQSTFRQSTNIRLNPVKVQPYLLEKLFFLFVGFIRSWLYFLRPYSSTVQDQQFKREWANSSPLAVVLHLFRIPRDCFSFFGSNNFRDNKRNQFYIPWKHRLYTFERQFFWWEKTQNDFLFCCLNRKKEEICFLMKQHKNMGTSLRFWMETGEKVVSRNHGLSVHVQT